MVTTSSAAKITLSILSVTLFAHFGFPTFWSWHHLSLILEREWKGYHRKTTLEEAKDVDEGLTDPRQANNIRIHNVKSQNHVFKDRIVMIWEKREQSFWKEKGG